MIASLLAAALATVPAGLAFEPWFVEREVSVSIARAPGANPWIRGVAELPVPAGRVYEAIVDYARYREFFDPAVSKASVLDSEGEEAARIHFVWPYPFPYRRRDAVVAYRGERLPDGRFRLRWRDDARATDPKEGVRIEKVAGETLVEPHGADRCRVTYTYLGDLGGSFPAFLEEKAWRHEPVGYILAIRRRLGLPTPPKTGT